MYDFTDLIAMLFLIWNTVRKLDVQKQQAEDFPHVAREDFERWQRKEVFAYSLGAYASMAKIALNLAWVYAIERYQPGVGWVRGVGVAIFASWGAALIASSLLGTKGRAMRGDLGISLKSAKRDAP